MRANLKNPRLETEKIAFYIFSHSWSFPFSTLAKNKWNKMVKIAIFLAFFFVWSKYIFFRCTQHTHKTLNRLQTTDEQQKKTFHFILKWISCRFSILHEVGEGETSSSTKNSREWEILCMLMMMLLKIFIFITFECVDEYRWMGWILFAAVLVRKPITHSFFFTASLVGGKHDTHSEWTHCCHRERGDESQRRY